MNHWLDEIRDKEYNKTAKVPQQVWENVALHLPKAKNKNRLWLIYLFSGIFITSIGAALLVENNHKSEANSNDDNVKSVVMQNTMQNSNDESNTISKNNKSISENIEQKNNTISYKRTINKNPNKTIASIKNSNSSSSLAFPIQTVSNDNVISLDKNQSREIYNISRLESMNSKLVWEKQLPKFPRGGTKDCYDFGPKKKAKFFFEVYAGPLYGIQSLKAKSAEYVDWKKRREDTETNRFSYLAGVRAGVIYRNFIFKAGFEYQQLYDQLNYEKSRDTQIVNVIQNNQLIRTDTITGRTIAKIHNYHRVYQIPLSLGYQMNLHRNALSFHLGAAINITTSHKGAMLNSLNQDQRFNNPLQAYKSRIGVSPFVSVQWIGNLKGKINYFIEPSVQFYPKISESSFPIQEKYIAPNVKIGLQIPIRIGNKYHKHQVR